MVKVLFDTTERNITTNAATLKHRDVATRAMGGVAIP
jgi:hypothetical protein